MLYNSIFNLRGHMIRIYDFEKEEEKIIKKIFSTVCKIHGIRKGAVSVDISMVDKEQIHQLNLDTRNVDKPTDVLSYPALEKIIFPFCKKNYIEMLSPEDKTLYIGEIIICREIMAEQAKEYGHSETREIAFLTTHGLLHLLGYDHIEEDMRNVMRAKEDEVLEKARFFRE